MPDPLLPTYVPRATAAYLAGQSPRAFRHHVVLPGLVEMDQRGFVLLASLERYLAKAITVETFLLAERAREKPRAYQQQYRRNHGLVRPPKKTGASNVHDADFAW
jgi:hypothetical protein